MNKEEKIKELYKEKESILKQLNYYKYIENVINMILYILLIYIFYNVVLLNPIPTILLSYLTSTIISIPIKKD
jgi:hypothetical protein